MPGHYALPMAAMGRTRVVHGSTAARRTTDRITDRPDRTRDLLPSRGARARSVEQRAPVHAVQTSTRVERQIRDATTGLSCYNRLLK